MMSIMSRALNAAIDPVQVMPVECEKPYINCNRAKLQVDKTWTDLTSCLSYRLDHGCIARPRPITLFCNRAFKWRI